MARQLDDRQQEELTAFVNALAVRAGYETTAEWSRDSGYPAPNLSNLRNGRAAIDGFNLLRLIRAAAEKAGTDPVLLASQEALEDRTTASAMADRLEAVEATMTELASVVRQGLEARGARESAGSRRGTSRGDRAE